MSRSRRPSKPVGCGCPRWDCMCIPDKSRGLRDAVAVAEVPVELAAYLANPWPDEGWDWDDDELGPPYCDDPRPLRVDFLAAARFR